MNNDVVNHPKHYTSSDATCSSCGHSIECIDVTRHMGFNVGNIVKYLWRFKDKNGLEDLKKARWYLDDLIQQLYSKSEPGCKHLWAVKNFYSSEGITRFPYCKLCGTHSLIIGYMK